MIEETIDWDYSDCSCRPTGTNDVPLDTKAIRAEYLVCDTQSERVVWATNYAMLLLGRFERLERELAEARAEIAKLTKDLAFRTMQYETAERYHNEYIDKTVDAEDRLHHVLQSVLGARESLEHYKPRGERFNRLRRICEARDRVEVLLPEWADAFTSAANGMDPKRHENAVAFAQASSRLNEAIEDWQDVAALKEAENA